MRIGGAEAGGSRVSDARGTRVRGAGTGVRGAGVRNADVSGGRTGVGAGAGAAGSMPFPALGHGVYPITLAHTGSLHAYQAKPWAQDCQESSFHIGTTETCAQPEMNVTWPQEVVEEDAIQVLHW